MYGQELICSCSRVSAYAPVKQDRLDAPRDISAHRFSMEKIRSGGEKILLCGFCNLKLQVIENAFYSFEFFGFV